jgi:hypothetical protein
MNTDETQERDRENADAFSELIAFGDRTTPLAQAAVPLLSMLFDPQCPPDSCSHT